MASNSLVDVAWMQKYHTRLLSTIAAGYMPRNIMWKADSSYVKNDLCISNNKLYLAKKDNSSSIFNLSDWQLLSGDGSSSDFGIVHDYSQLPSLGADEVKVFYVMNDVPSYKKGFYVWNGTKYEIITCSHENEDTLDKLDSDIEYAADGTTIVKDRLTYNDKQLLAETDIEDSNISFNNWFSI